ncbi:putative transcriptional regulator-like protein [Streptomyces bingchenggensis BCW-1]|uniref:Putative transcriptional regulator-like protein n=1 Tax=Streptomyces bingchenggensis (strain BCW-1) TaxID=749414 RepID=D7BU58_STRBB|nr:MULTISPECIES: WYL domain-containing protein [Streptomyces]ADI11607.1 putative transcriptional regulator-like protein [Streptomyces bingchenggensis BCW-1]
MAIAKAERLMNLALCLLGTRRPLTKRELRESIEAYIEAAAAASAANSVSGSGGDEAFNRMFERDKDDLRELGLIIETVESVDGEIGYLARRDSNRLPPITLDAEEAAALGLAAKVWQQARLAGAASGALQKLRAAGMPLAEDSYDSQPAGALEPRIPVHEAAFEPLMLACRDRRPVVFDYRKSNAARPEQRHVEPWALECWRGHWYLAGWDRERTAERVFRLSRITGKVRLRAGAYSAEVPDHVTVRETVERWSGETATRTARIKLRSGHGYPLRARALHTHPLGDGWDELEVPYGHGLDAWLVEFGPDVVVLAPDELRADVIDRLRAVAKG